MLLTLFVAPYNVMDFRSWLPLCVLCCIYGFGHSDGLRQWNEDNYYASSFSPGAKGSKQAIKSEEQQTRKNVEYEKIANSYIFAKKRWKREREVPIVDEDFRIGLTSLFTEESKFMSEAKATSGWFLSSFDSGSGDNTADVLKSTTKEVYRNTVDTEIITPDETTEEETFTTSEGSADWEETSSSGSTKITTTVSTEWPVPESCFSTVCTSADLAVPVTVKFAEKSTVSIKCSSVKRENDTYLYWYYSNENRSEIKSSNNGDYVNMFINETAVEDSGVYKCVLLDENLCCHRETIIVIYRIPDYRKHILIIGVIAAVLLILCLVFVVCQRRSSAKYTKHSKVVNGKKQSLLLS